MSPAFLTRVYSGAGPGRAGANEPARPRVWRFLHPTRDPRSRRPAFRCPPRARLPRAQTRARVADADLVAAYTSGVGSYRIAARFGISPATVRARLRAAGVRLRPPRGGQRGPTASEVVRMRATGLTVRELARHFGVSHVTILDRLKKAKKSGPSR